MTPGSGIAGVVLAGGMATRLGGGDKPLRHVGGQPILSRIVARLKPQVDAIAINANGEPARFAEWAFPVLPDESPSRGPLSGILAAMRWAAASGYPRLITVAGDTPFFPQDLAIRLSAASARHDNNIAVASSGGRNHHVFALWPTSLVDELHAFLTSNPTFSVAAFQNRIGSVCEDFAFNETAGPKVDPFFNVNTPEDLARADMIATGQDR